MLIHDQEINENYDANPQHRILPINSRAVVNSPNVSCPQDICGAQLSGMYVRLWWRIIPLSELHSDEKAPRYFRNIPFSMAYLAYPLHPGPKLFVGFSYLSDTCQK